MKQLTIIILGLIAFASCDMLDEVPKAFVSRENYYKNETDAEGAITGAYAILGPNYYGSFDCYIVEELHNDYTEARGSQASMSIVNMILDNTNIGRAATYWGNMYNSINRCNSVLGNVPNITDINPAVQKRILAEAYFLRAMAYFNLVRYFGPAPLRLKENTDLSELAMPRESEDKIYAQILEDALKAEADLPETVNGSGRASKWAAKMLLAQVYLTLEDWNNCKNKCDDIINSGKYSMVEVKQSDDFYKIFAAETHSEDIMSVHHSETRTGEITNYIHRGLTFPYNYSSNGYYAWLPLTTSFIGDSWDENDLRKSFNLYTEYYDENGNVIQLPDDTPVLFKKFITNEKGLYVYSLPLYRYPEALLMYAEASCMGEGSPSTLALECLNKIKRRAYGYDSNTASSIDYPAGMSKDEFKEAVWKERGYEFLLERRRWWDLKRTGRVKQAYAAIGKTFIDERMLLPIPENEINNNDAISQSDQNPGY